MDSVIKTFFERYARCFNQALAGEIGVDEVAELYANAFIAASPAGVMAGQNDGSFHAAMTQGYARYREIGTRAMRIRSIEVAPIDDLHALAHVAWTATYARKDLPEHEIAFDVHYLVQVRDGKPKVFGWVSGDEDAALREHGVI